MCTADVYGQNVKNNTWPEVHFMVFKTSLVKAETSKRGVEIVLDVLLKTPVRRHVTYL